MSHEIMLNKNKKSYFLLLLVTNSGNQFHKKEIRIYLFMHFTTKIIILPKNIKGDLSFQKQEKNDNREQ